MRPNPDWYSPEMSSAYGVKFDSMMLDTILYVVDEIYVLVYLLKSVWAPFL